MQSFRKYFAIGLVLMMVWMLGGCEKIVQVPEPLNTITSSEVFSNETTATSAVVAIYNDMTTGHSGVLGYANGFTTLDLGMSSDELDYWDPTDPETYAFQINQLQSSNYLINSFFWDEPYFNLYEANAVVEGLQASTTVPVTAKNPLLGEAEFLRAFVNFYLVNLYGNVPLVTTTDYTQTSILPRTPVSQVYAQILSDLYNAQNLLPADYSAYGGNRYRAIQAAATAMLARVQLYLGNWAAADSAASAVIANNGLFSLDSVNNVFLANSTEAIWQLVPGVNSQYATFEGNQILPSPLNSGQAYYYLTPNLLAAFEPGDERFANWLDSTNYTGVELYYPYKYKVKTSMPGDVPEYYMMLRLAEQYLIRAEAEAHGAGGGLGAAVSDINVLRNRAALANYSGGTDSASVLADIVHERQVELFAEWGHRWLDLKRWQTAVTVLTANKGFPVPQDQLLYPIPISELQADPYLVQNPGY